MAKKDKTVDTKTTKSKSTAKKVAAKVTKEVKVKKVVKAVSQGTPAARFKKLNVGLSLVLLLEALAILVLGKNVTVPLTTQYPAIDQLATQANGHQVLATATRSLVDVPVVLMVVAILVGLAGAHLMAATVYRKRYELTLERGVSESRWATFGVVGGIALVTIGLLSGITQLSSLLMIFVLMAMGCFSVWAAEMLYVAKTQGVLRHIVCGVGTVGALMPWVVLGLGVLGAVMYGGDVPTYLYGIYATMFLFTLAIILLTHYRLARKGKWADNYRTERTYALLGFGAVSLLAWQIFMGLL